MTLTVDAKERKPMRVDTSSSEIERFEAIYVSWMLI
ncbi:hypothetical protein COLO4_10099 [Corchorus olitorius]|uniref:Uncharacterized protein n=1 Tax=Corchorus olitorius TaxID=93759 RepID=A0A1R3KA36_9ROSI|nr:hypothetical protein COLO4_10099 [Corchorus olitorius]